MQIETRRRVLRGLLGAALVAGMSSAGSADAQNVLAVGGDGNVAGQDKIIRAGDAPEVLFGACDECKTCTAFAQRLRACGSDTLRCSRDQDDFTGEFHCFRPWQESHNSNMQDEVLPLFPLPLVLYNIPITTHHHIALDVVDRLRKHPNIVAIKDSAGDVARLTELLERTGGRDGDFPVLLGSSVCFTHGLKHGGVGLVPSGAHVVPADRSQIVHRVEGGNLQHPDRLSRERRERQKRRYDDRR